jgi:uncharacterized membrane protein YecN with MAPEG domain
MILPIALTTTGLSALVNMWLAVRCGQVRSKEKISIGDGGNDLLARRMRAHSNFAEFAPIVLILIGLLELGLGTSTWLWVVAMAFIVGRVLHGIGMDGQDRLRGIGIMITMLATVGLGLYALAVPHLHSAETGNAEVEMLPTNGG